MADFAQHLPLSQRPKSDETGVGTNWHRELAATLTAVADLLGGLTPELWDQPSLAPGWRIRDAAGYLVWRLGSPRKELLIGRARAYLTNFPSARRATEALGRQAGIDEPADLVRRLREIAAEETAGRGRHGITELTEAIVHGIDIAVPLGRSLPVDPVASGAVALRQALIAPRGVRGVLRSRTLVATDAGWRVGRGRAINGTAQTHLMFLFGRTSLRSP